MSDGENGARSISDSERGTSDLLATISVAKDRAEAAAAAAEQASSKANSESGFAFNAKQNAEEHARAISQVRGGVDADFTWLTTTKTNAEEAVQAISRAKLAAESDAETLARVKVSAEQDAGRAATAQDRAESAAAATENYRNVLGRVYTQANEEAASVTQAKATVEASAVAAQTLQAQVTERAAKAESDTAAIVAREFESRTLLQSMAEVSTTATESFTRVLGYQRDLQALQNKFDELRAKTEALLPGATSAGLASAFREQKARFDRPQLYWLITFVTSVALLLAAGLVGLPGLTTANEVTSWDSILRHIVNRLPLVGPLVWLGIYSGRNYMLALRMQDEYAFKEAISATFEGYKREMASIQAPDTATKPLLALCENVLTTLAQRPGRIYEGQHEDITPLAPVSKAIGETAAKLADKIGDIAVKAMEKIKPE